jgi:two-component system chemotaxis sensor kinase CheA
MASIDMSQFHALFFEESMESLDSMEQGLLSLSAENQDLDIINTIFRAAHSIKGGSGTFGFNDIAHFTHALETLLDEARDGKRLLDTHTIDTLLKCCDCIRNMVNAHRHGTAADSNEATELSQVVDRILQGNSASKISNAAAPAAPSINTPNIQTVPATSATTLGSADDILQNDFDAMFKDVAPAITPSTTIETTTPTLVTSGDSIWHIRFEPQCQILLSGNEPLRIFRELESLGNITVNVDASRLPELADIVADECYLCWDIVLEGDVSKAQIDEVFEWVIDECNLQITQENTPQASSSESNNAVESSTVLESIPVSTEASAIKPVETAPKLVSQKTDAAADSSGSSSIRVSIEKIDDLINLVGELVITQSMLSELGNNFDINKLEQLKTGLDQLLGNTKELQESVMSIRMVPISFAFNRFPRMIRDYAVKSGKNVELTLSGEQTELDKTIMEQLSDPLTHLVRNAIDHGIESAEDRRLNGKSESGTIHLNAYHKGGNIIVEISDDGHGIDAKKILAKAIQKGMVSADQQLTDNEIYDLIFEPGFSTAETISDISGRGVGMDVVRRNLQAIGGRVEINTVVGQGTTFRIHLPLTLAILDGQLIRIGDDTFIVPLVSIIESLQMHSENINRVAGDMTLYRLREENIPIIPVYQEFGIRADNTVLERGLLIVVEGDGQKVGLVVDDLLAQQQVVIKSLATNYRRIEGISGATILGNGSVALILDIPGFIQRATRRSRDSAKNKAA